MRYTMHTLITFTLTIIGGAITLSLGQLILKACVEPVLEMKKQIGRIAHDLDFYANQLHGESPLGDEARCKFRLHACELREKINTILWYPFFSVLLNIPCEDDVYKASEALIGQSNHPKNPQVGIDIRRDDVIKRHLKIKT